MENLELNDVIVPYRNFRSNDALTYLAQMPLVIADGRVPLSVANLMERRLNAERSAPVWKDNYFDFGDGFAYNADGTKFKIDLDSQDLRKVTPKSKITKNGALILGDGVYESLPGQEFTRYDIKGFLEQDFEADKIKTNPVWNTFARHPDFCPKEIACDPNLLPEYANNMFAEMKQRFKYNIAMGLYLASGKKVPTLRAAFVDGLESKSQLDGGGLLGDVDGRLVGVAPEALNALGKAIERPNLETIAHLANQYLSQGKFELRSKE